MAQSKNNPVVNAILKQYEDNNAPRTTTSKKYDLKNYFSIYLKEGIKTGSKRIRILPAADGGTPFTEMHIHSKKLNGTWKKFACLKNNLQEACPFCEVRSELLSSGKESDKELAKENSSRKMYVLRVIDKDKEEEGIKFWRFNHDYRNQGIMDKIISIIRAKGDVSDPQTGRDIIIDIARDQKGNCIVSGIVDCDPTPAIEDAELLKSYIEDARTWKDVYAIKPYDYLELVVQGIEPAWDKVNEKWVDKTTLAASDTEDDDDGEITMGNDVKKTETAKTRKEPELANTTIIPDSEDENDDLPF